MRLIALLTAIAISASSCFAEPLLEIAESMRLEPGEQQSLSINVTPEMLGRRPALSVLARLDTPGLSGSTYAMRLWLNDKPIDVRRMVNKPPDTQMLSGLYLPWFGQMAFRVCYSPDYEAANRSDHSACLVGGHAYDFILDLDGLVKEGENTLRIMHSETRIKSALVLADLQLAEGPERIIQPGEVGAPAPTGELPRIQPKPVEPVEYSVEALPAGGFAVVLGDRRMIVRSMFSYPNAGWNELGEAPGADEQPSWRPTSSTRADGTMLVAARGNNYSLVRTLTPLDDHIAVSDRLTNTTDEPLLIAFRHSFLTKGHEDAQLYLHGLRSRILESYDAGGDNPTVLLNSGGQGFGMVAEDDVFRAHCAQRASVADGDVCLYDYRFMLPAGGEYEVRWSVYPVPGGEYFDFVNAIRRNWGTNFTIPGAFAFAPHPVLEAKVPDWAEWLEYTSVDTVSLQIPRPRGNVLAHGLAFLDEPEEQQRLKQQADMLRSLKPGLKVICYVDVYLRRADEQRPDHVDARHLGPDRVQREYSPGAWRPHLWLFLPTLENSYGEAIGRYFDLCVNELGFDGIYWDEMSYSAFEDAWALHDGYTADPDISTWTIKEPIAWAPLYCQGFQEARAKWLLETGRTLFANGQPRTETMAKLHFPRFVEAWHASKLRSAHLYCPVGLGSPDRIMEEADIAGNIRENLENGGLWYYYLGWSRFRLTRKTITEHMYPFTPIELHGGYVIGEERIITCKSGLFGWGDTSAHDVHVYDDAGVLQPEFDAPTQTVDGMTYTELRLPGGWLAAIVRMR